MNSPSAFITEKGSIYNIKWSQTIRWKKKTLTLEPISDYTVYISDSDAKECMEAFLFGGWLKFWNNRLLLISDKGVKAFATKKINFDSYPTVGMRPVEFWGDVHTEADRIHIGNKITNVW